MVQQGKPDGAGERRSYVRVKLAGQLLIWGVREGVRESNIAGPAAMPSASGPVGTALQWQASGLLLS